MRRLLFATLVVLLPGTAAAADGPAASVLSLLRAAGATQFAQKDDYGATIEQMTLGYDAEGAIVIGIAARKAKTYKKVTTLIAVTPGEDQYTISKASIPDLKKLPGRSRTLATEALEDITGKVFPDQKSTKTLVDAVTGATKYYKAIYVSYSLMANRVIGEIEAKPDWPKAAVPPLPKEEETDQGAGNQDAPEAPSTDGEAADEAE